jgi:hypothetical protein
VGILVSFLTLEENHFNFSTFSMKLANGLSYIIFIILRPIVSFPSFIRAFILKGWILSKAFSDDWDDYVVLSLLLSICCITWMICICWTIPASLEWNKLDHSVWSFDLLLNSVCQYFFEDFGMYLRDWPIILFFVCVFLFGFEWVKYCLSRMSLTGFFPFCLVEMFDEWVLVLL